MNRDFFIKLYLRILSLILPVSKRKILFISYYGSQYGCNPKYISEYLNRNSKDYDLVWAFTEPQNHNIKNIRKVRYYSLSFFYELCTAKVIVTNYRMTELFMKRRSQIYLQTWHSSLRLKKIEKDEECNLPESYIKMAKNDSQFIDCLISGCSFSTQIFKNSFWYSGMILESGTPRNDLFFQDNTNLALKIKSLYHIPQDNNLILYAPTFRNKNKIDCYNIDYKQLEKALSKRFGKKWSILVRLHPHLMNISEKIISGTNVVDVTAYDDVQELLAAADVLITDYSSLMFDFTLTQRPCFLYVPDLNEYTKNDRKLYFDIYALPFIKTFSNEDLCTKIETYDEEIYKEALSSFDDKIGSFEDGHACERIAIFISNKCFKE